MGEGEPSKPAPNLENEPAILYTYTGQKAGTVNKKRCVCSRPDGMGDEREHNRADGMWQNALSEQVP